MKHMSPAAVQIYNRSLAVTRGILAKWVRGQKGVEVLVGALTWIGKGSGAF